MCISFSVSRRDRQHSCCSNEESTRPLEVLQFSAGSRGDITVFRGKCIGKIWIQKYLYLFIYFFLRMFVCYTHSFECKTGVGWSQAMVICKCQFSTLHTPCNIPFKLPGFCWLLFIDNDTKCFSVITLILSACQGCIYFSQQIGGGYFFFFFTLTKWICMQWFSLIILFCWNFLIFSARLSSDWLKITYINALAHFRLN